ncbi:MAG TPA: PaaI family thioesterase [Bryobacteraceae bacterium]|nr:PaaI family thioesterase [Bryobacteraceae bacterium]
MDLACSERELQHLLTEVAFTRNLGFRVDAIGDGHCRIHVPFQEAFERPGGIISGQVFMAAADVAMWLAIKTKFGLADSSVTAEMKTNFLGAAKKEAFHCNANVLKAGRRLIYGTAECVDVNGRLLTHSTVTYIRGEKS